MKKSYYLGIALMSSLAFFSCSTDDEHFDQNPNGTENVIDNGEQSFTVKVANSGDQRTRAGRPMYGSEAKQSIENVRLIICNKANNQVAAIVDESNWQNNSVVYTEGGHGREEVVELTGDDKLAAGTYVVYAFGYSNNSDYDLTAITTTPSDGSTFDGGKVVLGFKKDATNKIGEEIFAGSLEITVKAGVGFKQPIVLNRQVAGAFAYVKDIPYFQDMKYLKLVASTLNNQLVLGQYANTNLTGNGTANDANVKYVVNGANDKNNSTTICTIDLDEWFTQIVEKDNQVDISKWQKPSRYNGKATFKKGSVFGGEFLIPFAKTSAQTLKLKLTKGDGSVLREWIVKLPGQDAQLNAHTEWVWNSNTSVFDKKESVQDSQTIYSIVRNHLYGIGTRTLDDPGNGTDPEPETNPDTDNPESLNTKQDLTLQVNDNWEVIHKMEIE